MLANNWQHTRAETAEIGTANATYDPAILQCLVAGGFNIKSSSVSKLWIKHKWKLFSCLSRRISRDIRVILSIISTCDCYLQIDGRCRGSVFGFLVGHKWISESWAWRSVTFERWSVALSFSPFLSLFNQTHDRHSFCFVQLFLK